MRPQALVALIACAAGAVAALQLLPPPERPSARPVFRRIPRRSRVDGVFLSYAQLRTAFVRRNDWMAALTLADAYRKGEYPHVAPNPDLAADMYRACCASPDPDVAGLAQLKYIECRLDPVAHEDVAGRAIPARFALECVRHAETLVAASPCMTQKPKGFSMVSHASTTTTMTTVPRVRHILSDAQNVHDHALGASLRKFASDAVREDDDDYDETYASVLDVVLNHGDDEERGDAYKVLESLSDAQHSRLDMSERQALQTTWAKLRSLPEDIRRDAEGTLVKQLASGVESGDVVCSTGKIARIAGALDGISPDAPALRPLWAVREELGALAARVRDKDAGDAGDFRVRARQTYVDDLGMNPAILEPLVEEFVLGF